MGWKSVFKKYQIAEIEEKGKEDGEKLQQFSQLPLFPLSEESKITNNEITINLDELKKFLAEDWEIYKDNQQALIGWADLLAKNRLIEQGIAPSNFTAVTHCAHCGDVLVPPALVNGGQVLGCMWCFNRMKNLPIPKPSIDINNEKTMR